MAGIRQVKKNLKKAEEKLASVMPIITTKKAKKEAQEKTTAKIVAGIAAGAAVGAAAGLLLAPKPGKEARKDLKDKAEEAKKIVKEKSAVVAGTVKKKLESKKPVAKGDKAAPKKAE